MKSRSHGWRVLFTAVALLLMTGCAANPQFVYKPGAPVAGGTKLPVKVAVLPFKDGTEDFTRRGSIFSEGFTWNLAKTGVSDQISPLTPALWAKSFADDMTASGDFQAVRFIYSPSELTNEEFYIEGTLGKAYYYGHMDRNEFAIGLRAMRKTDNRLAWEKEVRREWKYPMTLHEGCGMNVQCRTDRILAATNKVMQGMFAEARADLVGTLASLSKGQAGEARKGDETSTPQVPESVEQTIDKILKGK